MDAAESSNVRPRRAVGNSHPHSQDTASHWASGAIKGAMVGQAGAPRVVVSGAGERRLSLGGEMLFWPVSLGGDACTSLCGSKLSYARPNPGWIRVGVDWLPSRCPTRGKEQARE